MTTKEIDSLATNANYSAAYWTWDGRRSYQMRFTSELGSNRGVRSSPLEDWDGSGMRWHYQRQPQAKRATQHNKETSRWLNDDLDQTSCKRSAKVDLTIDQALELATNRKQWSGIVHLMSGQHKSRNVWIDEWHLNQCPSQVRWPGLGSAGTHAKSTSPLSLLPEAPLERMVYTHDGL